MGNASARDWYPMIGKRFNPLETVNTHTHIRMIGARTSESEYEFSHAGNAGGLAFSKILSQIPDLSLSRGIFRHRLYNLLH